MKTETKLSLAFLKNLRKNNNRDWFKANKSDFEKAKAEFEQFIDALILKIAKFDSSIAHHSAKDCVFRIYRDVRFSKDKSPYKTNFGAHITSARSKSEIHSRAGYYIHLEPGKTMLAGGAHLPKGDWLTGIREEIVENTAEFKKILRNKSFTQYFGEIEGEKLKNGPKNFPKDHPEIELLKYKSFLAKHDCSDKEALSDGFLDHCAKVFKALYPFDQFLNKAAE